MSAQKGYIVPLVLFGTLAILSGIGLFSYLYFYPQKPDVKLVPRAQPSATPIASVASKPLITDFDSCQKAGYPIQESYPGKCSAEGKIFTEVVVESSASASAEIVKEGWTIYKGTSGLIGNPAAAFIIQYPGNWEIDQNVIYPFGKGDKKTHIVLGALGHGWFPELEIVDKEYPSGPGKYSWGKPNSADYYSGFASITGEKYSYVFEANFVTDKENLEIKELFDEMLSTFKPDPH